MNQPRYLEDYVMKSETASDLFQKASVECELLLLLINNEARFYEEAKVVFEWRKAYEEEIESIKKNKTWFLVDKPSEIKVIGLK